MSTAIIYVAIAVAVALFRFLSSQKEAFNNIPAPKTKPIPRPVAPSWYPQETSWDSRQSLEEEVVESVPTTYRTLEELLGENSEEKQFQTVQKGLAQRMEEKVPVNANQESDFRRSFGQAATARSRKISPWTRLLADRNQVKRGIILSEVLARKF